jgi:tRNA A64-2'-O-ribosylphosphate transferase
MPDALSKTVPIWCSVLNRYLFPENPSCHSLYTPPQVVSESEHAQISALLEHFLASLKSLDLQSHSTAFQLSKPLRPIWVTPESHLTPTHTVFQDFHPIICCTVSRRVSGGELSEGGYIQGAGDDTENWAHGLSPAIFWENQETLMSKPEHELLDLIEMLVQDHQAVSPAAGGRLTTGPIGPTSSILVRALGSIHENDIKDSCVISLLSKITDQSTWYKSPSRMDIGLGPHKLGSRGLRLALPSIATFAEKAFIRIQDNNELNRCIISCESGTDLSIGVALALLCLFFDENGILLENGSKNTRIDKLFIRRRLGWISTSLPDANPSRATLQSVNSFLMEPS